MSAHVNGMLMQPMPTVKATQCDMRVIYRATPARGQTDEEKKRWDTVNTPRP
jgi:hypothetical protein